MKTTGGWKSCWTLPLRDSLIRLGRGFQGFQRIDKELKINFNGVFIIIFWWKTRVGNLLIEFRTYKKNCNKFPQKYVFSNFVEQIAHFLWAKEKMSDLLKKTMRFAHSLICPEQPERIAHICSFVMNDLSDSLRVAHLSCATSANCSHLLICSEKFERMSEFPTLWKTPVVLLWQVTLHMRTRRISFHIYIKKHIFLNAFIAVRFTSVLCQKWSVPLTSQKNWLEDW